MGYRSTNTIIVTAGPVEVGPQAPGLGTARLGLAATGTPKKIVSQGGSTAVGLAVHNSSTRVAPQGGVGTLGALGAGTLSVVTLSGSFTHITITRSYELATGESPTGVVYFTPSDWLLNNAVTIVPAARPAALDSEGQVRIDLAANNDLDTAPTGSYYTVLEEIIGQPQRSYKVVVPYDAVGAVDLADLPVIP